jgi:hypothetical protein
MRIATIRLLALFALLLMPFGMAAAQADPGGQNHSASAMLMNHCPEQQSDSEGAGGVADCAMPCSAALPAADLSPADSQSAGPVPAEFAVPSALFGLALEIATPPPKLS